MSNSRLFGKHVGSTDLFTSPSQPLPNTTNTKRTQDSIPQIFSNATFLTSKSNYFLLFLCCIGLNVFHFYYHKLSIFTQNNLDKKLHTYLMPTATEKKKTLNVDFSTL